MLEIIKIILKEEFKYINKIKQFIAIVFISIISFFVLSRYVCINNNAMKLLIISTLLISIYESILWTLSLDTDSNSNIWLLLPIKRFTYNFSFTLVIYFRYFIFKISPVVIPITIKNIFDGLINCYYGIFFIISLFLFNFIFVFIIVSFNKKLTKIKGFKSILYKFKKTDKSYKSIYYLLFKREFKVLISNKVILINHLGYLGFLLLFIINNKINNNNSTILYIFALIMLSFISTPATIYSIEKNGILLYELYPINLRNIFLVKYFFSIIIILPAYIITIILVSITNMNLIIYFFIQLFTTTLLKVFYDFKYPMIKFNNAQQLLENKRKYNIWFRIFIIVLPAIAFQFSDSFIIILCHIFLSIIILYHMNKVNYINKHQKTCKTWMI